MKVKALALVILAVLLSLDASGHENEERVVADSQKEVYEVMKTCLSQSEETDACYAKSCKNESKYLCAEEILEAAVLISGPEKAMEVLHDILPSPLFGLRTDGHPLAHIIGESITKYLGKTGEFFLQCPDDFSYGCQHGFLEIALAEHNDSVKAAESICESLGPSPSKDGFCYHGVGHGLMFYESYDLKKALSLCDSFPAQTAQRACWEGVFMENVNGRIRREPAALSSFKEDDPLAPCNSVETKYREQCYRRLAPYLVYLVYPNDPLEGATNACLGAGDYVEACMTSIGFMAGNPAFQELLAGSLNGSVVETAVHICNKFPAEHVQTCYRTVVAFSVERLTFFERPSEFCMAINTTQECFRQIASQVSRLIVDNDQYEKVCSTLPDEFRRSCMGRGSELPDGDDGAYDKTSVTSEPDEDDGSLIDRREEKKLAFFDGDSLKKVWTLFRASLELIRDEFFKGPAGKKTIDAPGQALKPEPSLEEEAYSADAPDKVSDPGQDSERLHDDDFMDEKMRDLRSLTQSLDRSGQAKEINCHVRAHEFGRSAYELFGNDPRTKTGSLELGRRAYELFSAEALEKCRSECGSGCKQGLAEAFFPDKGADDLLQSIRLLCGEGKGLYACIARGGHALMQWSDYDLHRALKECDLIENNNYRFSCHSGVFRENILAAIAVSESGGEIADVTSFLSDDPHYPCNILDDRYKGPCYHYQPDYSLWLFGSLQRVGDECAKVPEQFQYHCFNRVGRASFGYSGSHVEAFESCGAIPEVKNRNACLGGVIGNLFWSEEQAEKAISFCKLDHHPSFHDQCYDRLIDSAIRVIPQSEMEGFCGRLPGQHREKCNAAKPTLASSFSVGNETEPAVDVPKTDDALIRYVDGEYVPNAVHVSVGQSVTWVNDDQVFWPASDLHPTHTAYPESNIIKCFTSEKDDIFDACEARGTGATYAFTFNTAGSWKFHDHINPRATGTVIVSE